MNALASSAEAVGQAVEPFEESGTTLTALAWTGSQLALVHIGDTRAYLLRDGRLFLITHDDTVVQAMVDAGDLDPSEAASHPQRAMLVRALTGGPTTRATRTGGDTGTGSASPDRDASADKGAGTDTATATATGSMGNAGPSARGAQTGGAPGAESEQGPDIATFDVRLRDTQPGDRFLLCSDGLSAVVAQDDIREALSPSASPSPEAAVTALLALVDAAGAPDNAGCVVAEVVAL